ncbi:type III PLP-dependent enzyme domain-containing protein [Microterricola viridarii]|uniref:Ornithine decarboxylase n=1 Tax=Microterricola viridarii TaxID=412690 RepID=A0A1H1QGU8_9MICO|nr:hypothetical protein [Microterricola viridarii]SDS22527.1 ornithine decarboxylase [Microterricola viridarii]
MIEPLVSPRPIAPSQPVDARRSGREELALYAGSIALAAIVKRSGTPLFVLDPDRIAERFAYFGELLPFARLRYALAALPHPAVIRTIAAAGGGFDVVSTGELAMLAHEEVPASAAVYSHPIKRPAAIAAAAAAGVRLFVADNPAEVRKFLGVDASVRLLIRVHFDGDGASFGVDAAHAMNLARFAVNNGIRVAGFSVHVDADRMSPRRLEQVLRETLRLIDEGNARWRLGADTLDLGGGLPAEHEAGDARLRALAAAAARVLEPRAPALTVLAALGRCVAAPAMLLATRVVGQATRDGAVWHYLDDGMHGSFAGLRDAASAPAMFSLRELLEPGDVPPPALYPCTVAGASTDGLDVIARDLPLPSLGIDDVLLCPNLGAYSLVLASNFEAVRRTRVHVLHSRRAAQRSGAVDAL